MGGVLTLRVALLAFAASGAAAARSALVIRGGTLFDGTGAPPVAATVVVVGETIRCVGAPGSCEEPAAARVLDASGRWLLPGLIDTHAHSNWGVGREASERLQALRFALGVTTVREAGADDLQACLDARERSRPGEVPWPRLVVAGRLSRADEEHFGAPDPVALVRFYADRGVDSIKLKHGGPLSPDLFRQILEAAHQRGLTVHGHAWYGAPPVSFLESAVEAGLDGVSHLEAFLPPALPASGLPPEPGPAAGKSEWWEWTASLWEIADGDEVERLAALLVARRTVLEPVLAQYAFRGRNPEPPARLWYVRPERLPIKTWVQHRLGLARAFTGPDPVAGFPAMQRFVRDFQARGGRIVAGSDTQDPLGLHREVQTLMEAGLEPGAALRAATSEAAAALGLGDVLGTVEVGKMADLLVLPADPREPAGLLAGPTHVIKGGVLHESAPLLAGLEAERRGETVRAWLRVLGTPTGVGLALALGGAALLRRRRSRVR